MAIWEGVIECGWRVGTLEPTCCLSSMKMNFRRWIALYHQGLYALSMSSVYLSMMKKNNSRDACLLSGHEELKPCTPTPHHPSMAWTIRTQDSLLSSLMSLHYLMILMNSISYPKRFLPSQITSLFNTKFVEDPSSLQQKASTECVCPVTLRIPISINSELWQVSPERPTLTHTSNSQQNLMSPHPRH